MEGNRSLSIKIHGARVADLARAAFQFNRFGQGATDKRWWVIERWTDQCEYPLKESFSASSLQGAYHSSD
jgi:hypothetical protein